MQRQYRKNQSTSYKNDVRVVQKKHGNKAASASTNEQIIKTSQQLSPMKQKNMESASSKSLRENCVKKVTN